MWPRRLTSIVATQALARIEAALEWLRAQVGRLARPQ